MDEKLYHRLFFDLHRLKMPVDEIDLYIRPFSKTYYGRYFPSEDGRPRIFVYPFANKSNSLCYSYTLILTTAIHEMVHHIQYTDPNFKRYKGVMHDTQFWQLYNHYVNRARKLHLIKEDRAYA